MATVIFDTYRAVNELQEAGFDEAQAVAMVSTIRNVLGGNLATKEDIQDMATKEDLAAVRLAMATKEDLAAVRLVMATKEDLAAGRQDTKEDFAAVRQDMATKADIKDMATKADLHALETKLTIRMGMMIFGAAGLVLAILRLFPNFFG